MDDMKRIGIMQPYFFPYLGYFQLIHAVDEFVFYDDVAYIKRGWINRNRILVNGQPTYITVPCKKVSQNRLICDTEINMSGKERRKLCKTMEMAYKKAPHFTDVYPLFEAMIMEPFSTISALNIASTREVCHYLGIKTRFTVSSEAFDNQAMDRADRLIDICQHLGGTQYLNAIGGQELYEKDYFRERGVDLYFLQAGKVTYPQWDKQDFVPWLSVLDIMMFNDPAIIVEFLDEFTLV